MAWSTSPAATELEQVVLDWLAQLLGLPRGWHGHIEDTASTGDARRARPPPARCGPDGVVYASEHANFSVEKAVRILGLEYRTVPVDDEFRMVDRLPARRRDRRRRDRRDDLVDLRRPGARAAPTAASEAGVWLHVDAAYAGSAAVCPELRWCLDGCDRADSIVVNPHKWLFTPIDCSALWTRRPEVLRAAFSAHGDYLAVVRGRARPARLRARARPPLPRAQALDGAALVRRARGCRR